MKLIDLSWPLYEGIPACYGHAAFKGHPLWPEAFKVEMPTPSRGFHVYTIFSEIATRLIVAAYHEEHRKTDPTRLHNIDLKRLVNRDAVIIDVPKGVEGVVGAAELEAAFKKAPVKRGDALFFRTGWGDNERDFKMGHDYREKGPCFVHAAGEKIMELMAKNGSDMWVYDTAYMNGKGKNAGEINHSFMIRSGMIAICGAVNCGAITKPRVKLTALPLMVKDCYMGPCRVVATEE